MFNKSSQPKTFEVNNLGELFLNSLLLNGDRNALWINGIYYTYHQLYKRVRPLSNLIKQFTGVTCAIYSNRNLTAYVGILSTLLADKAYAPLNPKMPLERNLRMLKISEAQLLIVDPHAELSVIELLKNFTGNLKIILYDFDEIPEWTKNFPQHQYFSQHIINSDKLELTLPSYFNEKPACLLFTSGSTGLPKGIMLTHKNILTYLSHTVERYELTAKDRISQATELTFDFSVQDLFVSWKVGACVYALPENHFINFPKYISENKLTILTTVPSTVRLLWQMKKLRKGIFPSLRMNLFGGEALSNNIANIWQAAAINTQIDNVYGPTEATIAFTSYKWNRELENLHPDCVPIGKPFPGQDILIINPNLTPVTSNQEGELCLSGEQVVRGYWKNIELSQQRFITLTDSYGHHKHWYRTGDIVTWDNDFGLLFKGRCDDQIQIRGYRVEKLEVEHQLRLAAKTEFAAVIPWPVHIDGTIGGLIGFVSHSAQSRIDILKKCREQLPDYMTPRDLIYLPELPLNVNGKTDYLQLKTMLHGGNSHATN